MNPPTLNLASHQPFKLTCYQHDQQVGHVIMLILASAVDVYALVGPEARHYLTGFS